MRSVGLLRKHLTNNTGEEHATKAMSISMSFIIGAICLLMMTSASSTSFGWWFKGTVSSWFGNEQKTPAQIVMANIERVVKEDSDYILGYFNAVSGRKSLDTLGPNFGSGLKSNICEMLKIPESYDMRVFDTPTSYEMGFLIQRPVALPYAGKTYIVSTSVKFPYVLRYYM